MEIEQKVWGMTPEGEAVVLYTMRNKSGAEVLLTNIGAAIVGVRVPDRNGDLADVVLGYAHYMDYFGDGAAMGKTVGRYANRIANGVFSLDGQEYRLARNNGPNHLHGGPTGFANRLWTGRVETDRVVFSYVSADGEEGFPGEVGIEAVYDWDDEDTLELTLFARTSKPTIVNLTNHVYFNLAGESSGSVLGQELRIDADKFLPTDDTQIPTGELADVEGTPMDFRTSKALGRDIDDDFKPLKQGFGYDHCWVLNEGGGAELYDPASGRTLTVSTTQPGLQVYTGNFLNGGPQGKSGRAYADRDGVALECQNFPDSPNKPSFPSPRLDPGETYEQHIVFKFGVKN